MGGKSMQLSIPFAMTGGRGGDREFPLQITATLMDSMLSEAGLKRYVTLLEMTPEEETKFRSSYYREYHPPSHILIWCELRTIWAELHLDTGHYIIFIEDDGGNQCEPIRILEQSQPLREMKMEEFSQFQSEQERWGWRVHQKNLMLCFPKRDFLEKPVLSERVKYLKLVFLHSEDREKRAEGTWVFQ